MNRNQNIMDTCKKNNMTLTELGRKIGKSKQYMSELARGNIRLTYDMAVKIANVFESTPDEIFLNRMSNNIRQEKPA